MCVCVHVRVCVRGGDSENTRNLENTEVWKPKYKNGGMDTEVWNESMKARRK